MIKKMAYAEKVREWGVKVKVKRVYNNITVCDKVLRSVNVLSRTSFV